MSLKRNEPLGEGMSMEESVRSVKDGISSSLLRRTGKEDGVTTRDGCAHSSSMSAYGEEEERAGWENAILSRMNEPAEVDGAT